MKPGRQEGVGSLGRRRSGVGMKSAGASGGFEPEGQDEDLFSTSNSLSPLLLSHNSLNL